MGSEKMTSYNIDQIVKVKFFPEERSSIVWRSQKTFLGLVTRDAGYYDLRYDMSVLSYMGEWLPSDYYCKDGDVYRKSFVKIWLSNGGTETFDSVCQEIIIDIYNSIKDKIANRLDYDGERVTVKN